MAPSDPLHGEAVAFSEETRAVVRCIMASMAQLLVKLLGRADSAPASREELEVLLHQETATAIPESGILPPHSSRDGLPRALHPANHSHHQDRESLC